MILSHKIQLQPNKEQQNQLAKACGCARFTYNWGLSKWTKMYESWKSDNNLPKPNANLIKKEFNKIKEAEFPWIYESPKDANQQAFAYLGAAFSSFFNKITNYPKFKKRGNRDTFYISNDKFSISDTHIRLPLIGKIRITEKLRFEGKINSCVISRKADKWYASISVDVGSYQKPRISDNKIGIDFGLTTLVTDNQGNEIHSPMPLKSNLSKLARYQRKLSRRQKGSKNRDKQRLKVAKLHLRISNIRHDFTHKLTTQLCSENQAIIIEDLSVKSWMKKYGKSTTDTCIGKVIRQLSYKKDIYDNILHKVNKWYPSTKTCSSCGHVKAEMPVEERTYKCEICGFTLNRDYNAAINIYTAGLAEINDCGHQTSEFDSNINNKSDGRNSNLDIVNKSGKIYSLIHT
jgi:putative transposase